MELPSGYLCRMKEQLGDEYPLYLESLERPVRKSLRINTGKWTVEEARRTLSFLEDPVPWCGEGFYYDPDARPAIHPAWHAGLYYLQEASAMTPGAVLPVSPGNRVLDLCAAPGGKSTQLAARLGRTGYLLSNDISISRARILLKNLEMAGIPNLFVTAESPGKLADAYQDTFDAVLADVPCSGEGMFHRDPQTVLDWVSRGPSYYQPLQREILREAARLTAPGGFLLYSTCTFSEEENEENIQWFLEEQKDFRLVTIVPRTGFTPGYIPGTVRIWPHHTQGEGHFLALMRRMGTPGAPGGTGAKEIFRREGAVYLLPENTRVFPGIRYLRTGLYLGDEKKGRQIPSHAQAMSLLEETDVKRLPLGMDDQRVLRYLRGETLELSAEEDPGTGYVLVCLERFPLGWGIAGNGRLKNKYPAAWRML